MIEPTKLVLFVGISWALIITPGPDMLYVITRGVAYGRKAGIVSAIGVICGILVHTTATAFGLSLMLQTSAVAFLIIKYVGAIYLIHLGIKTWQDRRIFNTQTLSSSTSSRLLFRQGMMSNILNPKIAIFFLAFLPQFVDRGSYQVVFQLAVLGLIFAFFGLCFLVFVGYFAGTVGIWLTSQPRYIRSLRWVTGGVLISLGARLALSK